MLIDGKLVPSQSGETFEAVNPATGEVLAQVARGNAADIDRAVSLMKRAKLDKETIAEVVRKIEEADGDH